MMEKQSFSTLVVCALQPGTIYQVASYQYKQDCSYQGEALNFSTTKVYGAVITYKN